MADKGARLAEDVAAQRVERCVQLCIMPDCGATYGLRERVYVCPRCDGPLEIICNTANLNGANLRKEWEARAASREPRDLSGVWRYRELLPFDADIAIVTLFEGNTPLYDAPRSAQYAGLKSLRLKHQGCNPTGSFKDTGMTAAITQAVLLGDIESPSCAPAPAILPQSLASAYAARAGLQSAILLPQGQISAAKLAQTHGLRRGQSREIEGNFDDCMRLSVQGARRSRNPSIITSQTQSIRFALKAQKTVAFELMAQCDWKVPDHVVVPGGNLGNSSALGKGFEEMLALKLIDRLPKLSVIQAAGSAPLATLFRLLDPGATNDGELLPAAMPAVDHPRTLATAIKIGAPVSWRKSVRVVLKTHGQVIAVSEREIADAKAMVGRDGVGCEPASATTVAGIRKLVAAGHIRPEESVVAVLTGHVLKDPDYVSNYHRGTLGLDSAAPIDGAFKNAPVRVSATKKAILESLECQK